MESWSNRIIGISNDFFFFVIVALSGIIIGLPGHFSDFNFFFSSFMLG